MSRQSLLAAGVLGVLLATSISASGADKPAHGPSRDGRWVETWGTAQMVPAKQDELQWRDGTLRQIVHVSLGGKQVRIRISNVFGTQPLVLASSSVALAAGP